MTEIIVDSFAGGGGASLGIEMALGRSPDIAINHDAEALAIHMANHPDCLHLSKNIWKIDPLEQVRGRPVGLAWFSPDCKHFSKAKGGKPVARNIRDLAWVVVLWARRVRPRVIILENVEEFRTWGPLTADDMPCRDRRAARPSSAGSASCASSATGSGTASLGPATTARRPSASGCSSLPAATDCRSSGRSPPMGRAARCHGARRPSASTGRCRATRYSSPRRKAAPLASTGRWPPVAVDPGKDTLDNPASRLDRETDLTGFNLDDFDCNACCAGRPLSGIT